MTKISFYPLDLSDSNSYISRVCQAIRWVQPTVEIQPLVVDKTFSTSFSSDVFWLNWFEDLGKGSKIIIAKNFILKLLYLLRMKISRGKVVVVLHNKSSHEVVLGCLSHFFMWLLLNLCDKIVILCDDGIPVANQLAKKNVTEKISKILHPSYICLPKQYSKEPSGKFSILFFGLLRPYKNIELLLNVAQKYPDFDFIISGKPIDEVYATFLLGKAEQLSNVFLELKYNTDAEIEILMNRASILVLPYHLVSTLNSGVAMYAFSKGINVVMPEIGSVRELNSRDLVFSYQYTDEEQHQTVLEQKICEVYSIYNCNYAEFVRRAEVIREEVLSRCSIEAIGLQIQKSGILDFNALKM